MNTGTKIGAAVLGGYLLGRRRKAKLALAFGGWLVGKKLNLDPKALAAQLGKEVQSSPQFSELRDQLRHEVITVGKTAATDLVAAQTNRLADTLHERTQSLKGDPTPTESDEHERDSDEEEEQSTTEESAEPTAGEQGEEKAGEAEEQSPPKTRRPKRPASPKKPTTGGQQEASASSSKRSSSRASERNRSSGGTNGQEGRRRSDRG